MLVIRHDQMRALSIKASRTTLIEHARSVHAEAAAALGDPGLGALVTRVVEMCSEYGLESTADQVRLLDLAVVFGADWQLPELRWLDEGMRDPRMPDPTLRVRRAWRRALRHLARRT